MTDEPYDVILSRPARRALAERLPADVAIGAVELINGAIATAPHRVGKPLDEPLADLHAARLMREWRILYAIDDLARTVTVRSIRHRRDAYKI